MKRITPQSLRNPDQDEKISSFLEGVTCEDIKSDCRTAVILTTELLVKNALQCLIVNKIRAAILMDPEGNEFVGMLTISDFMNVFRYYQNNPQEDIRDIKRQKITDLRRITAVTKPVVTIDQKESLLRAARLLVEEKIHRIIVTKDPNKCKFILSKKRILRHLHNNMFKKDAQLPFIRKKIDNLKPALGTWGNIATVTLETKVTEAFDLFFERRVSALPVVDENGKVMDIFAKFDAFIAAKGKIYKMDMNVAEALKRVKGKKHERLFVCERDETLLKVVDRFVVLKVHRLVVVDQNNTVIGIISLSDVLKLLSRRLDKHEITPDFLRLSMCKDLGLQRDIMAMPSNIRVIYGLEELAGSNIGSAPLCADGQFIGMLTISDFINILLYYNNSGKSIEDIKDLQVTELRRLLNMEDKFISIHSDDSLFNAAELLIQNKIHRLFVIDGISPFMLTKRMILKYLWEQLSERNKHRCFHKKTVADLKPHLGTWNNIATVTLDTRVYEALNLFCERKVSSVPVVDEKGRLIEVFAKSDVFALIRNEMYDNRHLIIPHALEQDWERHEYLCTCRLNTTLREVIRLFATEKVHRLLVVDVMPSVIGIISTSDILKFLLRMPSEEAQEVLGGAVGGATLR